jgi:hypothetical protein
VAAALTFGITPGAKAKSADSDEEAALPETAS